MIFWMPGFWCPWCETTHVPLKGGQGIDWIHQVFNWKDGSRKSDKFSSFCEVVNEIEKCESKKFINLPFFKNVIKKQLSIVEASYYLVTSDHHCVNNEKQMKVGKFQA